LTRLLLRAAALLVAVWAVVFLGIVPSMLVKAQNVPFTASPADVALDYEDITVSVADEGLTLRGWWMPAENATSVILFAHGANANREDHYFGALDYYAALVARGHHVLTIDLRNHGESDRTPGGRLTFGQEESRDVIAAIATIESLAPGLPIIGSGVSMGGATLIEAAARDPRLSALVLIDPLLDKRSASMGGMVAMTGLPRPFLRPTLWSSYAFFGLNRDGPEALTTAASLEIPVLLIQDPDDPVTRAEFAAEAARSNPHIDYHVLPAVPASHPAMRESEGWGSHAKGFRAHEREVLERITAFLNDL
jgi:pimeloyl-ACP methyl ester carboxylesterase